MSLSSRFVPLELFFCSLQLSNKHRTAQEKMKSDGNKYKVWNKPWGHGGQQCRLRTRSARWGNLDAEDYGATGRDEPAGFRPTFPWMNYKLHLKLDHQKGRVPWPESTVDVWNKWFPQIYRWRGEHGFQPHLKQTPWRRIKWGAEKRRGLPKFPQWPNMRSELNSQAHPRVGNMSKLRVLTGGLGLCITDFLLYFIKFQKWMWLICAIRLFYLKKILEGFLCGTTD